MNYRVRVERSASKAVEDLPSNVQRRLADRLLSLGYNPRWRARKLEGVEGYRVRVGDYRILYRIDEANKTVFVWRIGHRWDVYR